MELIVDEHKGISTLIAKQKLPSYLYQMIHNLELSKILGKMVKRKGYKNILTTGLTTLKSIFEFVDKNDGRQIFIQDGTGVEESVYSGGAYGAIAAISNDERTGGSTVDQAYPVLNEKILRSGAGLNAATDLPFWYGYNSEIIRFSNSADPRTISAGKYLDEQFYDSLLASLCDDIYVLNPQSYVAGSGIKAGTYVVYLVPVLDGKVRGLPYLDSEATAKVIKAQYLPGVNNEENVLVIDIYISNANKDKYKRVTDIDVFIGNAIEHEGADELGGQLTDPEKSPAYFLERISLADDSDYVLEITGNSDTGGTVVYTSAEANWMTFNVIGMHLYNVTQDEVYRVTSMNLGTNTLTVTPAPTATQAGDTLKFFSRWWYDSGNTRFEYQTFYDDYYKKLGSEMYERLGIPAGDVGRGSDLRYKYGCMSNKRYFIFGVPEGSFGYFSKVNGSDIIPALNLLKLKKEPKGCVSVGRDVMALYKDSAKRFTVLSNANAEEDDDFSDIGLVDQKALYQLSDKEVYGFDQRGPWHLYLRNHQFIGEDLKEWWEDNLSETEKNACVVGYNRLKNWVMFSFPTYTTSPYTVGIVFVFDRDAQKRDNVNAWWVFKTDVALYNFTQADDLHLLAGSKTKIVDLNTTATPDETVATLALLRLMQNPILGNRFHVGRALFDYDSATDTVVVKVSADGAAQESLTVSGDKQAVIKYMCKTLELEISTAASANEVEYGSHIITFHPKRV